MGTGWDENLQIKLTCPYTSILTIGRIWEGGLSSLSFCILVFAFLSVFFFTHVEVLIPGS